MLMKTKSLNSSFPVSSFRRCRVLLAGLCGLIVVQATAQVPTMLSYQGRVQMNNTNFGGSGQFKFALVQGAGSTLLWKSDGSAAKTELAELVDSRAALDEEMANLQSALMD